MAKKKGHTCDWVGCRKRKGVDFVYIPMQDNHSMYYDNVQGWLCPLHRRVMEARLVFEDIKGD